MKKESGKQKSMTIVRNYLKLRIHFYTVVHKFKVVTISII